MEPIWGFILYIALACFSAGVASKRGRPGGRYLLALIVIPVPLVLLVSAGLGNAEGKGTVMALAAFACPVAAFLMAVFGESGQQAAVSKGEYGDYKKCPHCAEPVRKEAVKCKHCHSDLSAISE